MLAVREQLEQTRSHLLSTIDGLTFEMLNNKLDESTWSIAQVVEHIAMVERATTKVIALGMSQEPTYVPRDVPLEQLIPDRSRKVNAPENFHPPANSKTLEDVVALLAASRATLMATLNEIDDPTLLDKTAPPMPHPVFGVLSTAQWITAVPLHEERHTLQIEEIKSKL